MQGREGTARHAGLRQKHVMLSRDTVLAIDTINIHADISSGLY